MGPGLRKTENFSGIFPGADLLAGIPCAGVEEDNTQVARARYGRRNAALSSPANAPPYPVEMVRGDRLVPLT